MSNAEQETMGLVVNGAIADTVSFTVLRRGRFKRADDRISTRFGGMFSSLADFHCDDRLTSFFKMGVPRSAARIYGPTKSARLRENVKGRVVPIL